MTSMCLYNSRQQHIISYIYIYIDLIWELNCTEIHNSYRMLFLSVLTLDNIYILLNNKFL